MQKIMTDLEKIKKLEALNLLREKIGGCFGDQDKIFASHTLDEGRAKELRKTASINDISLGEIQDIISGYLFRSGFYSEHIIKQTKKASDFFSKKLT